MRKEGIRSIRYFEYFSTARTTPPESMFKLLTEYYLDSTHLKTMQYDGGMTYWYVSVFDTNKE